MTLQQAFDLALQHHQAGRLAEAEAIYRQILAQEPNHADTLHLLGVIAQQAGRSDLAVELIRKAITLIPTNPVCHYNLGKALRKLGRLNEATAAYRRAIQLKPDMPDAHNNLGCALKDQGQFDEAIAAYRRALQLKPDYVEAHSNFGAALAGQGRLDEAIAACRRALQFKPDYAEAHNNLGNVLKERGQFDEAIAAFRMAIRLRPDYAEPHSNLGNAFKEQARLDEAMESYRRAMMLKPDDAGLHSNLVYTALFHPGYDPRALKEEGVRWEQQHGAPLKPWIQPHANRPDSGRRLKVGYVSPNFSRHVIRHFLVPLLETHDHAGFEIHCYSRVKRPDPITERMRKCADVWRDVPGLRDEALAALIREDGIDILVDLTQHMADNQLLVFARKPAPVQVAWLGYPGSTGLRAMDYRFTDARMEPERSEWSESVEKAVRLPDSWFCFDPIDHYPAAGEVPALRAGHVTFGCLNNFCKVNDAVLQRWAGVLRAVEGSRLLLRCPEGGTQARVRQFFEAHGIGAERLELVSWTSTRAEFLELFQRIDIALDPFPYNGGTTTCEALWMGVPVLTLPGTGIVSRIGLSILSAAGMPEFIAESGEEYVKLAKGLARDFPRLAELRRSLRDRMKASAFMDAPRFARNVEAAYREMWRAWCAKQCSNPPS